MTLKSQTASGVRWTTLAAIINTSLRLLQLIVLAHFLSPEDFGLMGMVWIIIGFIQTYIDLGMSGAIIHHQLVTKNQLSTLYWLNMIAGVFAFVIVWLLTPLAVLFFNEIKLIKLLHVVGMVFLISPWGIQFQILLQKELQFNFLAKQEIISTIIGVLTAIICAILGLSVWSLVLGLIANESAKTIILLFKGWQKYKPGLHFCRSDLKGFLSFGLYQVGERSVNYFNQRFDQLLMGSLLGAQSLGYYNFAFNLVIQPMSRINPVVTRVAFPVFSSIQNDKSRLKKGYLKIINLLTSINAPILFGLAMVAPLGIPYIFGEKWNNSIILVQILSLVGLCRSIGNPTGSLQLAKGRADLGFKWNLFVCFVSIPTIYLGGKFAGAIGIALALLCLQIILQPAVYFYIILPLIGKCAKEYFGTIFKPILISTEMLIVMLITSFIFSASSSFSNLSLQLTIGIISYVSLLWLQNKETISEFQFIFRAKNL